MFKKKRIFLMSVMAIASSVYAYEPSVYGAGDINSATPYGLTATEKAILENKKTLQMLYNKITEQQRKIDGLSTVIEGQNKEIFELKEQLSAQEHKINAIKENNSTYSLLLEMGQTLDNINNSYVSKDELRMALGGGGGFSSSAVAPAPINIDPSETYRQGVQLFGTRSYLAAKAHFEEALSLNYKPASTNYYLGEIAYYTQNYKEAIGYFKTSSSLNDQASYMDILFLHTAISLEKSGDRQQAKSFYQYVIDTYPNKKTASIARNRI